MQATYPFLFRDEGMWFSRLRFKRLFTCMVERMLHMHVLIMIVLNFGTKFLLRRGECKTREIPIYGKRTKS